MVNSSHSVAILQPTYLPWVGYFNMIANVDEFIFLDSVQFNKRSWQQRNRIKWQGGERWLTVPVSLPSGRTTKINEVSVADKGTVFSHIDIITAAYSRAPHFPELLALLLPIYQSVPEDLCTLNVKIIRAICGAIGLDPKFTFSSTMSLAETKGELIYEIANAASASRYLSAPGSRGYLEASGVFSSGDIELVYFEQTPLAYPQAEEPFTPYLSVVDMISNVGLKAMKSNLYMSRSCEG